MKKFLSVAIGKCGLHTFCFGVNAQRQMCIMLVYRTVYYQFQIDKNCKDLQVPSLSRVE